MCRTGGWWLTAVVAVLLGTSVTTVDAAVSAADQAKLDAVKGALEQVAPLYKAKKFAELGTLIEDAEKQIAELKESSAKDELAALETKLSAAQRLLKSLLDDAPKPPATPAKTAAPGKTPPTPAATVTFSKDVAPVLLARCSGCHTTRSEGGFNLNTFAGLMKGSDAGVVLFANKGMESTIVTKMVNGEMPPNGNRVPQNEIMAVSKWIDEGAKFDGPDQMALLRTLVPMGNQPGMPQIVRATGNEKVSFMRDIAPVLVERCVSCHIGGNQAAGRFDLSTFTLFNRGGQDGPIFFAGNVDSTLIKKIKGTQVTGRRMPARGEPLTADVIEKFETWVKEGAKFDGDLPGQNLEYALKVIKARKMTHEELSEWRLDLAKRTWGKSDPSNTPDVIEGKHHILLGRTTTAKLQEASRIADAVADKIAVAVKNPAGKPLLKGKLSLFIFDREYQVNELVKMGHSREPAPGLTATWAFDVIDASAPLLSPKDDDTAYPGVVAEQFAGAYLESLGSTIPKWFSVGAARVIAARVEPKSVAVKMWDDSLAAAASTSNMDAVLTANQLDATGGAIAYGLAKYMSSKNNAARFTNLIDLLKQGRPFDTALQQSYGVDARKLLNMATGR